MMTNLDLDFKEDLNMGEIFSFIQCISRVLIERKHIFMIMVFPPGSREKRVS